MVRKSEVELLKKIFTKWVPNLLKKNLPFPFYEEVLIPIR